jgi:F-type H+-transporting ATPase subunit delta
MTDRKLATRYAKALLASLPNPSQAAETDDFLGALADHLDASKPLRDVLLNPAHTRSARKKVLADLAAAHGVPAEVGRFLGILLDNGRLPLLRTIAAVFREEREAGSGIVKATITSAQPLNPELRLQAERSIARLTGRKVRLEEQVDGSLLGGAVTRVGSMVYDGSLRTQLERLKRRMSQE